MERQVSKERLEAMLDNADKQSTVFWGKETLISYRLESGFTICGRSACVDPTIFNAELGEKYAREDAINQLWHLEGYVLQLRRAGIIKDV